MSELMNISITSKLTITIQFLMIIYGIFPISSFLYLVYPNKNWTIYSVYAFNELITSVHLLFSGLQLEI